MWRIYLGAGLAVALAAGVWWYGHTRYQSGYAAAEAAAEADRIATQEELFKSGQRIAQLAAALEAAKSERANMAQELENAARQDPDGHRPGIGPDGVRRLERRWGAP